MVRCPTVRVEDHYVNHRAVILCRCVWWRSFGIWRQWIFTVDEGHPLIVGNLDGFCLAWAITRHNQHLFTVLDHAPVGVLAPLGQKHPRLAILRLPYPLRCLAALLLALFVELYTLELYLLLRCYR